MRPCFVTQKKKKLFPMEEKRRMSKNWVGHKKNLFVVVGVWDYIESEFLQM